MNCFEKLYTPAGLLSLLEVISGPPAFIAPGEDGTARPREPGTRLAKGGTEGLVAAER